MDPPSHDELEDVVDLLSFALAQGEISELRNQKQAEAGVLLALKEEEGWDIARRISDAASMLISYRNPSLRKGSFAETFMELINGVRYHDRESAEEVKLTEAVEVFRDAGVYALLRAVEACPAQRAYARDSLMIFLYEEAGACTVEKLSAAAKMLSAEQPLEAMRSISENKRSDDIVAALFGAAYFAARDSKARAAFDQVVSYVAQNAREGIPSREFEIRLTLIYDAAILDNLSELQSLAEGKPTPLIT